MKKYIYGIICVEVDSDNPEIIEEVYYAMDAMLDNTYIKDAISNDSPAYEVTHSGGTKIVTSDKPLKF